MVKTTSRSVYFLRVLHGEKNINQGNLPAPLVPVVVRAPTGNLTDHEGLINVSSPSLKRKLDLDTTGNAIQDAAISRSVDDSEVIIIDPPIELDQPCCHCGIDCGSNSASQNYCSETNQECHTVIV